MSSCAYIIQYIYVQKVLYVINRIALSAVRLHMRHASFSYYSMLFGHRGLEFDWNLLGYLKACVSANHASNCISESLLRCQRNGKKASEKLKEYLSVHLSFCANESLDPDHSWNRSVHWFRKPCAHNAPSRFMADMWQDDQGNGITNGDRNPVIVWLQ